MKKLLIASLIASTSLMAVADETTLYGAVGYFATVGKNTEDTAKEKSRANLDTDELWWGIKGEENISDNLNAFWKLEFNGNNGNVRHAYVGLKGDTWGTFTLGTQNSLFKILTNYNDIFQADTFWNSTTRYDEGLNRPSNTISYVSPNWSGFQFGIAGILNGKNNTITDNGVGITDAPVIKTGNKAFGAGQIGLWYNANGFYASLAYQYVDGKFGYVKDKKALFANGYDTKNATDSLTKGKGGTKLLGGSIGYKNDTFKVGLTEQHKFKDGDKLTLAGEYYFGPNTIRAGFSYAKSKELNAAMVSKNNVLPNDAGDFTAIGNHNNRACRDALDKKGKANVCSNKIYTYAIGYQYNLSKRTYTFVEANFTDWNRVSKNGYEAKVGLRHDF